jgi:hypothetical protein
LNLPSWALKFIQRVAALPEGRWQIILTVGRRHRDWTVTELGKVEADHEWNRSKDEQTNS